jgi:hypothetical protein
LGRRDLRHCAAREDCVFWSGCVLIPAQDWRGMIGVPDPPHAVGAQNSLPRGPIIKMKILDIPQSGVQGTMVSYRTRYGLCRRKHVIPRDPCTPLQVIRRKAVGRARFMWGRITDEQRAAWNARAREERTRPRLGQSGRLSGYLLFVRINCNLAVLGLEMVFDPPARPQFPLNPILGLAITNTNGTIAIKLKVAAERAERIVVSGVAPQGRGVTYVDDWKILNVLPEPDGEWSNITEIYVKAHGVPRVDSRVFVRAVQYVDGWQDDGRQFSAVVPEG